jgi:hydroxyacylglutathione hydrolase
MGPAEVKDAVAAGAVVLDLRPPRLFAAAHVPGAVTIEYSGPDLADRAELILPHGQAIVVLGEPEAAAHAAVDLLRDAGFNAIGRLEGGMAAWTAAGEPVASLPLLGVEELHERAGEYLVLDAREGFEYRHLHVEGSVLLPTAEAWERAAEIESDRPIAVICDDQTRSAAVASMLQRAGKDAWLVTGGVADWHERGYPVASDEPHD